MYLPIKWMKDYVNIDENTRKIADELTLSGSHVDSIIETDNGISNIVVGKIIEIEKHPNADKLVVTKVDIGTETITIVTGAPNVFEGAVLPVALPGAVLGDGSKIEMADFRGINSSGMFCSYKELGFADNVIPKIYKDGVLIIKDEVKLGTDIKELLDMNDEIIEFEITPNRPDCLSIIGMAREAAATFDTKIILPEINLPKEEVSNGKVSIKAETDKVNSAVMRVFNDIKVEESPNWLQNYLLKVGIRPVNNIVDIANFVMVETGHPLHTYDLDKVKGNVHIRMAKDGEEIKCIDQEIRKLTEDEIVITDDEKLLAIAGVMGGYDSEVTKETKNLLLESFSFDKETIRNSSKKLLLRSEASSRYEKGVNPSLSEFAANRFAKLIEKLGAGTSDGTIIKSGLDNTKKIKIEFDWTLTNKLLGINLTKEEVKGYLSRLEFKVEEKDDTLKVEVPSYRDDVEIEADLVEEVGRLYGFHNIEPKAVEGVLLRGKQSVEKTYQKKAKKLMNELGYDEVLTYSFISPLSEEKAGIIRENKDIQIKLLNPLGEEFSVMRTSLIPNMLDIVSKNQKNKINSLKVFEIGNVFFKENEEYMQYKRLVISAYEVDFYSFKADLVALFDSIGLSKYEFSLNNTAKTYHPGRCADIKIDGQVIGTFGELSYEINDYYGLYKRVMLTELDIDKMLEMSNPEVKYKKISKHPSMIRDIALVVDESVTASEIEKLIASVNSEIISEVKLFDIYRGEQIGQGKKSMTYKIIYNNMERTLKDQEVSEVQGKIIDILEKSLNISLRG